MTLRTRSEVTCERLRSTRALEAHSPRRLRPKAFAHRACLPRPGILATSQRSQHLCHQAIKASRLQGVKASNQSRHQWTSRRQGFKASRHRVNHVINGRRAMPIEKATPSQPHARDPGGAPRVRNGAESATTQHGTESATAQSPQRHSTAQSTQRRRVRNDTARHRVRNDTARHRARNDTARCRVRNDTARHACADFSPTARAKRPESIALRSGHSFTPRSVSLALRAGPTPGKLPTCNQAPGRGVFGDSVNGRT